MGTSSWARSFALASFLGTSAVGGAVMVLAAPTAAEAQIDESYFYASLGAHGRWVNNVQFGWVWYPHHRPMGWRPYTVGRWEWTNYGEWLWVSDEPFGWATYHYGRWYLDPMYGWVWLPGRVWAPAWVSWRDAGSYIGWAPLSPWGFWDIRYNRYRDWNRYHHHHHADRRRGDWDHDGRDWDRDGRDGRGGWDGRRDGDWDRGDDYSRRYRDNQDTWNFTRKRDFVSDRVDRVVLDRNKLPEIYRASRELPAPSEQQEREGRGITSVVDKRTIERASGRTIRPVKVENSDKPTVSGGRGSRDSKSDSVRMFRPKVVERANAPTPDKLGVAAPERNAQGGRGGATPADRNAGRAVRPGGDESPADRSGRPARAEPARDKQDPRAPARGDQPSRQPQSAGRERGDANAPEKATRPPSPGRATPQARPERSGKPDVGGYERPARADERGGYERPARSSDGVGLVRPDGDRGKQPARVQEPARGQQSAPKAQQPTRSPQSAPKVQQPTRSQQPAPRVQQPTRSQPAPRVQQPTRSQQPAPRVQQPSRSQQSAPRVQPSRSQPAPRVQQPSRSQQSAPRVQPSRSQPAPRVQQPSRSGSSAPRASSPQRSSSQGSSSRGSSGGGGSRGGATGGGGSRSGGPPQR